MDQPAGGPPNDTRAFAGKPPYMVQLLLDGEAAPLPRDEALLAVARRCGPVDGIPESAREALMGFAFRAHPTPLCAPPVVMLADAPPPASEALTPVLQQTWDWPDAAEVAHAATRSWLVSDLMASPLPAGERMALFVNAVAAVCEVAPVRAIVWLPAQKLIRPATLWRALAEAEPDPLFAPVNVRMFNVTGRRKGETVMDTIGLGPLGLPDVQCHFVGLPPGRIAVFLHSVARYLFARGPVIASGHTVAGPDGERWRCRWADALVGPTRNVIDVEPTGPHAARAAR
jgi:hypothetical protein